MREKGKETRDWGLDICPAGTKDCLWTERKQTRPVGKWKFIRDLTRQRESRVRPAKAMFVMPRPTRALQKLSPTTQGCPEGCLFGCWPDTVVTP